MKIKLRNLISGFSSYVEIFLSVIILVAAILASLKLSSNILRNYNTFTSESFHDFLGFALAIIIAVELIKMLSRHTPGSAVEVLLFALARKLIINENSTSWDLLLGVVAIAILFFIRKHYISGNYDGEGIMVSASTSVTKAKKITGLDIPEGIAQTVGGLVSEIAKREKRSLAEGDIYHINDITMRISKLRDGIIHMVEFFKEDFRSKE